MNKKFYVGLVVALVFFAGLALLLSRREANPSENKGNITAERPLLIPTESQDLKGQYVVGAILPPPTDAVGEAMKNALTLAVEEINSGKGVLGKKLAIDYVYLDAPENAKAEIAGLAKQGVREVILGPNVNGETLRRAVADNKMIALTTAGASGARQSDYLFTFGPAADNVGEGAAAATYAVKNLKLNKLAVIADDAPESVALKNEFAAAVKNLGGQLTVAESFKAATGDFAAQVERIKKAKPNFILVLSVKEENGVKLAGAFEGAGKVLVAGSLAGVAALQSDAATRGVLRLAPFFDEKTDRMADFLWVYDKRFNGAPASVRDAAEVNGLAYLIRDAVEKDKDDSVAMQKTFSTMINGWAGGALADITLDRFGDIKWREYEVAPAAGGTAEVVKLN